MSWLNNFKITWKISLIVALMAIVTAGAVSFAAVRMKGIDAAYSDLVVRVDKSTTMAVLASREAVAYISTAFQLAAEVAAESTYTGSSNGKLVAQTVSARQSFETAMAQVLKNLPEKSDVISAVTANFTEAFVECDPSIQLAAKTSSREERQMAVSRIKFECAPAIELRFESTQS